MMYHTHQISWCALLVVAACTTLTETATEASDAQTEASESDAESNDSDTDATGVSDVLDATPPSPPLQVLFVGNSYTYFNDLPGVVDAIVDATTVGGAEVASVTMGGATLADHWNSMAALESIESGDYDVVVLQGQSLETVRNPADFQDHAERFAGALVEVEAEGVWFATWARRDVESLPELLWPAIEEQYQIAAAHNGDEVARVGAAWEIALLALPDVTLFADDRSHPSPEGSLLASCVIARALTGVDPVLPEPTPLGIPRDIAEALCAIAAGGVPCDPAESQCDGDCVPWSPSACGACDVECAPGDPCRGGVCGCEAGLVGCDERCVRLGSVAHCNSCGDECGRGRLCTESACVCPTSAALDVYDRFQELTAIEPDCGTQGLAGSLACNEAAYRYCVDTGCFASGFLPSGHAPQPNKVMCVSGEVIETTYTILANLDPGCDGVTVRGGQACVTAAHRFCVADGAVSGFGPVDTDGERVWVTCLTEAVVEQVSETDLHAAVSRCEPDAAECSSAAWNLCEARGYTAGFGPVELDGSERDVICVD